MTDPEDYLTGDHLDDHREAERILQEIDGMIESTEEFIKDDGLMADEHRIHDLSALLRVRDLYISTFAPESLREQQDVIIPPDQRLGDWRNDA